jgi:hypothetical protein
MYLDLTAPALLQLLSVPTLAVIAWVAARRREPAAGIVLRLCLAALLTAAAPSLAGPAPARALLALVLQGAALAIAVRAAGVIPFRRPLRRGVVCSAAVPFEDFRRAA